jgi:hypothetical protein
VRRAGLGALIGVVHIWVLVYFCTFGAGWVALAQGGATLPLAVTVGGALIGASVGAISPAASQQAEFSQRHVQGMALRILLAILLIVLLYTLIATRL